MPNPLRYFRFAVLNLAASLILGVTAFYFWPKASNTARTPQNQIMPWQQAYIQFRDHPSNKRAEEQFRTLAALLPHDNHARYALAIVERETGRLAEAEALFQSLASQSTRRAGAFWNLGRLAMQRGDLNQAAICFEESAKLSPQSWHPVYSLAQVKQLQGLADQSKQLFKKARVLGSGEPDTLGGMGAMKPMHTERMEQMEWD